MMGIRSAWFDRFRTVLGKDSIDSMFNFWQIIIYVKMAPRTFRQKKQNSKDFMQSHSCRRMFLSRRILAVMAVLWPTSNGVDWIFASDAQLMESRTRITSARRGSTRNVEELYIYQGSSDIHRALTRSIILRCLDTPRKLNAK